MICLLCLILAGCGTEKYSLPYAKNVIATGTGDSHEAEKIRVEGFAEKLCVVEGDILKENVEITNAGAAALFDLKDGEVLYAKSVHEKMYPASLTKVMTALVALENASPDTRLVATDAVKITESGAATAGLKAGDTMTLEQALHILMIASSNDVALLIADNIGGSVQNFVDMMNERAAQLGASNTHFKNPHGLTDLDHYTTAYDMYLIFNQAIKYDVFARIISMTSYQTVYQDKNGKEISYSANSTNKFFKGQYTAPANVTVLGGKTGTTNAAGHCLILHSKDVNGNSYISVVMRCTNAEICYEEMIELLEEINN